MKLLKQLTNVKIPSVLLVTIPHIAFNWTGIYHSYFFNVFQLLIFFSILLAIQWIVYKLYSSNNKLLNLFSIFILTTFIIFWYGFYIVNLSNIWQEKQFNHQIVRGRIVLLLFGSILLSLEIFLFFYKKTWFYIQNIFLGILSMTIILFPHHSFKEIKGIHSFRNSFIPIHSHNSNNKPIILVISDEYSSPDRLANFFHDTSVYDFSKHLNKKGWIVKNSFYTYNTYTIYSLSSLFNFNLSTDSNYAKISINTIGSEKLMKSELGDSLQSKHIKIINYGIFDIGNDPPLNRLFYYPKNFTEILTNNSILPFVFYNTGGLKLEGMKTSYYPMETHNKAILNTLKDTLAKVKLNSVFVYTHLFMPHNPFSFNPDFKLVIPTSENYLAYWKFTNRKLTSLLDSLTSSKKYRIILTGDHGYRGSNKINPHYTFAAFYGFEERDINKIKSVQDLGSLINGYFKYP